VGINQPGNLRLTIRSEKEEDESIYLKEQNTKGTGRGYFFF